MSALYNRNTVKPSASTRTKNAFEERRRLPNHELPRFWWLYVPLAFFATRYAIHLFSDSRNGLESWFRNETGVVENMTVLLLMIALGVAICTLCRFGKELHLCPKIFLLLYCLGCIYYAGEETSWGQHWFGWETGDFFRKINDQQETNFHNTSVLLDRLPKAIISLLIFIGGIVAPLHYMMRKRRINYQNRLWWLMPTAVCLPTAVIASIATLPSKIERATDLKFYFDQAQETKELYIAIFILLFIISLYVRMLRLRHAGRHFSPF